MRRLGVNITLSLVVINSIVLATWVTRAQTPKECQGQAILTSSSCAGDELSPSEEKLAQLINDYRAEHNLPSIPISNSLTLVANRHVRDLSENIGHLTHDWSNCNFDNDPNCMWQAPKRLGTSYPGEGYENAAGGTGELTAEESFNLWKNDASHRGVILNQGIWKDFKWQALGTGLYKGYGSMWVGAESDSAS